MSQSFFVAVGHNGLRLRSADGSTWTNPALGKDGEVWRAVCFGNGLCVAIGSYGGDNIFAVSNDGVSWKQSKKDGKYSRYLRGLGFAKGQFLALGGDPGSVGSSRPFVMLTADGVAWGEYREIPGKHIRRRLAFGNDRFVAVGDRGRRATSPDGLTWQEAPDVKAVDTLVDVAFGKGVFVGVGLHGLRMTSADGLRWTDRQLGEEGEHLNSIVWAGDRFVAVGMGATWTSPDGRAWKRTPNTDAPVTMTFGNGHFVGSNWRGRLLRSDDAITWREVHKNEHHFEAVAFGSAG
jgi:hypothetical protein